MLLDCRINVSCSLTIIMNTLRRSFKKPKREEPYSEFQEEFTRFQILNRKRESIRVKNTDTLGREDVLRKIEKERSLMAGASKLLQVCQNQVQRIEASKTLILSRTREKAYQQELKLPTSRPPPKWKLGEVSLSDIRIPLVWNPDDLLNDKGDSRKFALFALVSCGTQVYDTSLVSPVDRQVADISFPDILTFSALSPSFKVLIQIYSYKLETSTRPKNNLLSFIQSKIRKPKSNKNDPELVSLGSCSLDLSDASSAIQCFQIESELSGDTVDMVPILFGKLCCRLGVHPYGTERPSLTGTLSVSWPESEIIIADCYAELVDWKLKLWTTYVEYKSGFLPWKEVRLDPCSQIRDDQDKFCIENWNEEHADFVCESRTEKETWLEAIYEQIENYDDWKEAAVKRMDVLGPNEEFSNHRSRKLLKRSNSKLLSVYNNISSLNIKLSSIL